MTEKQKRDAGMLYNAADDAALLRERAACKELCAAINGLPPSRAQEQAALLRRLLGRTGALFRITAPFWCDYGYNIEIGENFYANHNCVILDCARVTFGRNVLVGPDCGFYAAAHPIDPARRAAGLEYALPIAVGDNVWFGGGVRVMPGVTIGSGSVIGSGSIVTRDIPPGVVAAGNPCRVLRAVTAADAARRYPSA